MRLITTTLITIIVAGLHIYDIAPWSKQARTSLEMRLDRFLNQKEIKITGLKIVKDEEIRPLLPLQRSVFWWMFNGQMVETALSDNPLINRASIKSCEGNFFQSWGCFELNLEETSPRFITELHGEKWAVAGDGTFIEPLSQGHFNGQLDKLVEITGLGSDADSPDMLRGQVAVLANFFSIVELESSQKTKKISVLDRREADVEFVNLPFIARFSFDSKGEMGDPKEQAKRLKRLVQELGERVQGVARIDLPLKRMAVITMVQADTTAQK